MDQHQHQHLDDHFHGDNQLINHQNTDQTAADLNLDDINNGDLILHQAGIHAETSNYEAAPFYSTDNNPPDSYTLTKVADWLDHRNTFIERKASVKFASCVKNPADPTRRSVSLNQRPKLSIIGFRKKPVDAKSKHNNVRLFRNRSEPGRDYCLLITEPVSPRVSCVGRVGSVRVQGNNRKAGVWRSFKAAFSSLLVQANNRVPKITAA